MDKREQLIAAVMNHMGWNIEKTEQWFKLRNPLLGGMYPDQMIRIGRGPYLEKFINAAIEESAPNPDERTPA